MTPLKVLLVVAWYYPESVGGSEAYVRLLARGLRDAGCDVSIAAGIDGVDEKNYEYEGIPVYRYPVPPGVSKAEFAGITPPRLFERFEAHVSRLKPDVVHFHSVTRGCGPPHARLARSVSRRLFLTMHVPGVTCARGTMMRWGRVACDGRMAALRCSACVAQSRWPLPVALAGTPCLAVGMAKRHAATREFLSLFDGTVAVAHWIQQVLIENGVPHSKVHLCRHGLNAQTSFASIPADGPLRVVYLGRITRFKGIDVLLRALVRTNAPIELRVYGGTVTEEDRRYEVRLRRIAAGDRRIFFLPSVAPAEVPCILSGADVIAVPSRWLEAGPYVVLEAFAVGRPVLGMNLGGIAELVRDGIDGLLLPDSVAAWTSALERLSGDRTLVSQLQSNILPVRSSGDVASDMLSLYKGEGI